MRPSFKDTAAFVIIVAIEEAVSQFREKILITAVAWCGAEFCNAVQRKEVELPCKCLCFAGKLNGESGADTDIVGYIAYITASDSCPLLGVP